MFAALCLCCAAGALGYAVLKRSGRGSAPPALRTAESLSVLSGRPGLLFSSAAFDATNGVIGVRALDAPDTERYTTGLRCERVHFAAGAGLCLAAERGMLTRYSAQTFGPDFHVRHTIPLQGVPSRARVSPDGRRGAVTVFVSGDSYSSTSFSTRTTLIEMSTGEAISDLEQFTVTRDGAPFKAIDFNFWGVTFARNGNRFFATLRTAGTNYLIEGNVDARTARVMREGVECPSLSPDNSRLAFKSRLGPSRWRLHVLDVASLKDTPLAETRSVDDQPEWFDDRSVAYMLPNEEGRGGSDIWTVSVKTGDAPRLLAAEAFSPVWIAH
jgi:hypothetical protein